MKKIGLLSIGLLFLLLSSCGSLSTVRYHVYDEFKDNHKYTVIFTLTSQEWNSDLGSAEVRFVRDVNNTGDKTTAYFVVNKLPGSYPIDTKGFIKADTLRQGIDIREIRTNGYIIPASRTIQNQTDSSKVNTNQLNISDSNTRLYDQFQLQIPSEMIRTIKGCKALSFRFYFGPSIATYKIYPFYLSSLKKLLNEKPSVLRN